GRAFRPGRVVGSLEHLVGKRHGEFPSAEIVSAHVAGDTEYPGPETGPLAIRAAVLQDAQEHLLHQVLRNLAIAGHAAQKVEQGHVIAVEEGPELGQVPLADRRHQGFVVHAHYPEIPGRARKVTPGAGGTACAASCRPPRCCAGPPGTGSMADAPLAPRSPVGMAAPRDPACRPGAAAHRAAGERFGTPAGRVRTSAGEPLPEPLQSLASTRR